MGTLFLNIYLASCVASFITNRFLDVYRNKRLKEEGYIKVKRRKTVKDYLFEAFLIAFANMLPVINVLSARHGVKNRMRIYEKNKKNLINAGMIKKVLEQSDLEEEESMDSLSVSEEIRNLLKAEITSGRLSQKRGCLEVNMTALSTDSKAVEGKLFEAMSREEKLEYLNSIKKNLQGTKEDTDCAKPEEGFYI